jgi:activator of HSP90 ATPase
VEGEYHEVSNHSIKIQVQQVERSSTSARGDADQLSFETEKSSNTLNRNDDLKSQPIGNSTNNKTKRRQHPTFAIECPVSESIANMCQDISKSFNEIDDCG